MTYKVLEHPMCPAKFPTEILSTSHVTGGTAKPLIGGRSKNKVCVNDMNGDFEIQPGTEFHI